MRRFLDPGATWLRALTSEQILAWAAPPITARLYVAEPDRPEETRSTMIEPVARVPLLLASLRERQKRFVLYLTGLERSVPELNQICARHDFGYRYRHNGSRFSLCFPGRATGLGLHADRTDSLLVQLHGRRRWKIYAPAQLPTAYLREVMTGQRHRSVTLEREADAELVLEAGDALYVPVTYGHDGFTPDDAPSFSFAMATAWQALTPLYLLRSYVPSISSALQAEIDSRLDELIQVVPDPPPGEDPVRWSVERTAAVLGSLREVRVVPERLQAILSGAATR